MKKRCIICASVCVPIFVLFAVVLRIMAFKNSGYDTPKECFFSRKEISYADFSRELPERYRDLIPEREIAVLPMDDYMVYYVAYVHDKKDTNDLMVAFVPMKIQNGKYHFLSVETYYHVNEFEMENPNSVGCAYYLLDYTIVPANSPEINSYDPDSYDFANGKIVDSDGILKEVVFCYTYDIYWEPGDGSFSDKYIRK